MKRNISVAIARERGLAMSDIFVGDMDVTPDKKILQSISSDIDLKKGILELIDNSIDEWKLRGRSTLRVELSLDVNNKSLSFSDNAGGIKEGNLNMVIQPGGTTRKPEQQSIGEFGIGLKRAIVALSRKTEVISRFESDDTFKIIVDDSWITSKSWKIPKFKTSPIALGSTIIKFQQIKFDLNVDILQEVTHLLSETYCFHLSQQFKLLLNGEEIKPTLFESWAFPPHGRHPRTYKTFVRVDGRKVTVDVTVGLMLESSQTGEYGFDVFCNDRLILKNYKGQEIGFVPGLLGYPHPTIAWFKGIVRINGANTDMPWNSTKSGIDFSNPMVSPLKTQLLKFSKPYVQLSRRLSGVSKQQIAAYTTGKIETVNLIWYDRVLSLSPSDVPQLPPGKRSQAEVLLSQNKSIIKKAPWTRALVENVYVADLILKKFKLENKNRFGLLLLDTCLEVAFRDYLLRVLDKKFSREQRSQLTPRQNLVSAVKDNSTLPKDIWKSIDFFYDMRCALYHETASPEVTDSDIESFRETVATILHELHGIVV